MALKIRKATKEDLDFIDKVYVPGAIAEIKLQFPSKSKKAILEDLKKHEKSRKESFLEELNKDNVIFVIAEYNSKPFGFGVGVIEDSFGGKMGLLDKIYLEKDFRRKDFGTKIAKYLMKELRKQGADFFEYRVFTSIFLL